MTDYEMFTPWWGVAVEGVVDLAIGGVDTDLQGSDQHRASVRNSADVGVRLIEQFRYGNVTQVNTIWFAGKDRNSFHGIFDSSVGPD